MRAAAIGAGLAVVTGLLLLAGGRFRSASVDRVPSDDWQIAGVWSDACPCDSFCPCWFNSLPTHEGCNAVSLFLIEEGRFGRIPLGGLAVVEALASPGGMTMIHASARGGLRWNRFYLDARASEEQRRALERILSESFAGTDFHAAAIETQISPRRHVVSIPGILDYEVVLLAGYDGKGPVRLLNAPFADASIPELQAGRSIRVHYRDGPESWEFAGRHATFARFAMRRGMYVR